MSERPGVVRSYQRLFAPDRRIYAVDGRTLPVPGGVPLRWLGAATACLLVVLALTAISVPVVMAAGASAGGWASRLGRRRLALAVGAGTAAGAVIAGVALSILEWPLRLIVVPAALATVLTQVSIDGRPAHRFAISSLRARIAGRRRLGRAMPARGESRPLEWCVRVVPDVHGAQLRRARVTGPGRVRFASPLVVVGARGRRRSARPLRDQACGLVLDVVELDEGKRLEVRP